jgi:uncharacterized cysteine cluster protein YcgN (CxxCxxCC family)
VLQIPDQFWRAKALTEMSSEEWEALCDGCGLCCLQKFKNGKTGKVQYTSISCYLLDIDQCRCKSYAERHQLVKDCVVLTPQRIFKAFWLPRTCAYRLLSEGKDLPQWHPLVSRDTEAVHAAGISARTMAVSEEYVHPDDVTYYLLEHKL